jgi:hypothetical protein
VRSRAESGHPRGGRYPPLVHSNHAHQPTVCDCGPEGLPCAAASRWTASRSPAAAGRADPDSRHSARITMPARGRVANRCPAPLPAARPSPSCLSARPPARAAVGRHASAGRERPCARRRLLAHDRRLRSGRARFAAARWWTLPGLLQLPRGMRQGAGTGYVVGYFLGGGAGRR